MLLVNTLQQLKTAYNQVTGSATFKSQGEAITPLIIRVTQLAVRKIMKLLCVVIDQSFIAALLQPFLCYRCG